MQPMPADALLVAWRGFRQKQTSAALAGQEVNAGIAFEFLFLLGEIAKTFDE